MAIKQKQSVLLSSGLPLAPWIFVNNAFDTSTVYAEALCSLIPHARFCESLLLKPLYEDSGKHVISIWANSSTVPYQAAKIARAHQVKALERGCNMASVSLCNDASFRDFLAVDEKDWPVNHITINIDGAPVEEVGKRIFRWLFTVLSVRETLHLIPESEMLARDTKSYGDYKYCALTEARKHRKDAKLQFIVLIASKPELTEPNIVTWKVVDRSGEAKFYFHHRGPISQYTWDWVHSLKVGDRKVLPRMPMVALHEPILKKIALSPLRVTGATIRGFGHGMVGLGRGVHFVGDKVSIRRSEEQKYMPETDWLEVEAAKKQSRKEKKRQKKMNKRGCVRDDGVVRYEASTDTNEKTTDCDFKIFNEKGEKTWIDSEDDTASAVASTVDEKVEKEFC